MSNVRQHPAGAAAPARRGLGLLAAVSIGVGGMIGAGIFSILGVVAGVSGTALPVSFVIGGVVAILAAYSYLKLGVRYPSVGGASQFFVEPDRLAPSGWGEPQNLLFGAGILFIGYEGFGLITNAAGEMTNPRRELPRAIYLAVGIVILIYVLVAIVVIGNLSISALKAAEDSALAEAARPFLGQFGFTLIAIAALLSTSSAVNATLFGAANVAYQVAKDGELPESFTRKVWSRNSEGLFITAGLVVVFVALFDLGPIAMMGSAAFLIVYTAVSFGHLRVHQETGARPLIIWASLVTLLIMFVLLTVYILNNQPAAALALVVTLGVSVLDRKST